MFAPGTVSDGSVTPMMIQAGTLAFTLPGKQMHGRIYSGTSTESLRLQMYRAKTLNQGMRRQNDLAISGRRCAG